MLTEFKTKYQHYFEDELGRRQGEYKQWFKTGALYKQCFFVDDKLHGECIHWFRRGPKDAHCFYKNGTLHGEYRSQFTDGSTQFHCFYINGIYTSFNELTYPETNEDRMYFKLKYNIPLLPAELVC